MGEKEWERLSEQERQRKMIELRLKEKKLRKEGRFDEAAALMGMLNLIIEKSHNLLILRFL